MVEIPERKNTTISLIDSYELIKEPRTYLSMSSIGHSCIRKLWMDFRWCTKIKLNARILRIFERGDIEEARIIKDLKKVGCYVYKQFGEYGKKIEMFGTIGEEQEEII